MDTIHKKVKNFQIKLKTSTATCIQTEKDLEELIAKCEVLEKANEASDEICNNLEDKLEEINQKVHELVATLAKETHDHDDSKQIKNILEIHNNKQMAKGEAMLADFKDVAERNSHYAESRQIIEAQILVCEEQFDEEEERMEDLEEKLIDVEKAQKESQYQLKTAGNQSDDILASTQKSDARIEILEAKVKDAQQWADKFEAETVELENKLDELEEQKAAAKATHAKKTVEFDELMDEMKEFSTIVALSCAQHMVSV